MSLSTITQVQWPKMPCKGGGSFSIIMNRPGTTTYAVAATDTLIFTPGPALMNDPELSQKFQTNEGSPAAPAIEFDFLDSTSYTGTVNGAAVSEEFGTSQSTVLTEWFNTKGTASNPLLYWVWINWYDKNGTLDKAFVGTYDARNKVQSRQFIKNPESGSEVVISTRTVQVVSAISQLNSTTWREVLALIGESDCQQGEFYNGFVDVSSMKNVVGSNNTIDGVFAPHHLLNDTATMEVTNGSIVMQAVPFLNVISGSENNVTARSSNYYNFVGRADARVDPYYPWGPGITETHPWPTTPWQYTPLTSATRATGGHGYAIGDTGTFTGGTIPATYIITSVTAGVVDSGGFTITYGGEGYQNYAGGVLTFSAVNGGAQPGSGIGFQVTIGTTGLSWGPWGTWGIKMGTLIAKMCEAMGFDTFVPSTDMLTPMAIYRQKADETNKCFPLDTSYQVAPEDYWVSLNLIAGAHPWDGQQWFNPCAYKPTDTLAPILRGICDFLLSNYTVSVNQTSGKPKLVLTPWGTPVGALPTNWVSSNGSSEDSPYVDTVSVTVNNKADSLQIVAPLLPAAIQARTSSINREVGFRLRQIGISYPANFTAPATTGDWNRVMPYSTFDAGADQEKQAEECFVICSMDSGRVGPTTLYKNFAKSDNCWKALTGVYSFDATGAKTQAMYPSCWPAFDSWNSSATSGSWTNTFHVLGCQYGPGEPLNNFEPDVTRFNSLDYQAVVLAYYLATAPTYLTRNYGHVAADDGTLSSVGFGFTKSWHYDGQTRTFLSMELSQKLISDVSSIKWRELPGTNFPKIGDLTHGPVGGSGGGGTQTTPTNTAGTGSGTGTPTLEQYVALYPTLASQSSIQPKLDSVGGLAISRASATDTANLLTGFEEDGTTVLAKVDSSGNITGTSLVLPGSTSGTVQLKAPATAGTQVYTLPSSTGTANYFLQTDGAGNLTWANATSGTVTSVGLSGGTTGLTISGSPVTTSGTMTLGGTLAVANGGTGAGNLNAFVLASPASTSQNTILPSVTGVVNLTLTQKASSTAALFKVGLNSGLNVVNVDQWGNTQLHSSGGNNVAGNLSIGALAGKVSGGNTAAITLDETIFTATFDCSAGAITQPLPQASTCAGRIIVIGTVAFTHVLTVNPHAGDTVGGGASVLYITSARETLVFQSDGGTDWVIIAKF